MSLQPSLFDALPPIVAPLYDREATIQERFEAFHASNPGVYEALLGLVMQMRQRGVQKYGVKSLFEVLRWHRALQTQGEEWKLNNVFSSRYARKMIEEYPELENFFELRELKSE